MRTGIVWVFLLASLSLLTARGAAHRADLIEHWRREATPVTRDVISNALALAETTVTVVTEAGANVSALSAELSAVQRDWAAEGIPTNEYESFYFSVRSLRREILFNHPSLNFEKILINRNPPTTYSHNGDQHLGMHSRPGPGLTILTDWKTEPVATSILTNRLPCGATRNPNLSYDANRVVFAFCDHTAPGHKRFFLYEAAIDGSWVRQLTGTARDTFETWQNRATVIIEDNDPCYLPDGGIIFISTRSQTFGRCHGGRYNPAWVLYRCDANGNAIQQLSFGNENEYEPAILNDGRIIFTRWEYTNRHEMYFHKLWWCRPDGTSVGHYYGNDTLHPMEVIEASAIPGTETVVATAQGHHSYNTGTSVLIDINKGENGEEPLTHLTPETPYSETYGWPSPHYSHPYPVTENLFLVSRANHPVHNQGRVPPENDRAIYLIDTFGGRELIYEDPSVASFSPIAVRPRKRPPIIPDMLPAEAPKTGTLYVQNVYLTRNDPENKIKPGMIKAIRVNALGVQPRAGRSPCSMTVPVEIPKKVLGTVAVDETGSAFFTVPAETSLQLQILDENGRAILTEKSLIYLQRGENRSCVGCHSAADSSPVADASGMSGRGAQVGITPPAGPQYEGGLSFMRTVQPVLDRYCIGCHGLNRTEKDVNLIHDGNYTWPRSLAELIKRGEHRLGLKPFMNRPDPNISRPFEYFAYGNSVPAMLMTNHGGVNIDRESFQRIVDWLDLNAQCYGDLFPNKVEERRIDAEGVKKVREQARTYFGDHVTNSPERALINAAQPDESRVLMAPLAEAAGGWGQVPGWASRNDPGYTTMVMLVEQSIIRLPHENTRGWQPTREQGGGEEWVIRERAEYVAQVQSMAKKLSYRLSEGVEEWPLGKRERIQAAMEAAIALYNEHGIFTKCVTANWSPGTPTADANYEGWINFGGSINTRTALHEIAHTLGVGTVEQWHNNITGGKWTGEHALKQLREFDGREAVLHADRMHFWPYGLNYENEDSEENRIRHVKMVAALCRDMSGGNR